MSAQHTPGPWHVEPAINGFRKPAEDGAKDMQIIAANGICPGIVWDYMAEGIANAEFIARACNAHDELLAALRKIEENCQQPERRFLREIACAAIAKAEGAQS